MILPIGIISEDTAKQIKLDLWAGHMTQDEIGAKYNVTQPTISRIFRGSAWPKLPWPDGSLGHIPEARRTIIHASRNRKTRYQYDSRSRNSKLEVQEVADINAVVESLLATEDSKLRSTIERKATETRRRTKRSDEVGRGKYRGNMFPWPDIKELDPGHPIVQALEREDDAPLKVALRIICAKVPQEDWQRPAVLKMVEDEAAKIRAKIS